MASTELTVYKGKRTVKPRQLFIAEPAPNQGHVSAALRLLQGKAAPSDITAEDAARAFAAAPRPLPFSLPRRPPRARPRLALGFNGSPSTPSSGRSSAPSPASEVASCSSECIDESASGPLKQLRDFCSPGLKETSLPPDSARHARYGTVTAEITSVSDFLAAAEGEVIDTVSGACTGLSHTRPMLHLARIPDSDAARWRRIQRHWCIGARAATRHGGGGPEAAPATGE